MRGNAAISQRTGSTSRCDQAGESGSLELRRRFERTRQLGRAGRGGEIPDAQSRSSHPER